MGIEVKQLTINSTLQRQEPSAINSDDEQDVSDDAEKNANKSSAPSKSSSSACFDADAFKAEVLSECRRLIKSSTNDRFAR